MKAKPSVRRGREPADLSEDGRAAGGWIPTVSAFFQLVIRKEVKTLNVAASSESYSIKERITTKKEVRK